MRWRKRREFGSTLILVLAAVFIASMVAISYLIFADNLRERAARTLDQDQREMTAEQGILEIEEQIRKQLISSGFADLGTVNPNQPLSFRETLVGQSDSPALSVGPIARLEDRANLTSLINGDPFEAAMARVQLLDLTAVSKTIPDGKQRLLDVQLTAAPRIAIREIPVSQFTVYSAGDPFVIASTPFETNVGRVFCQSTINIVAGFASAFPVVSRDEVTFDSGSLQFTDADSPNGLIGVSMNTELAGPVPGSPHDFLAYARTRFDSRLITNDVLPVECAPVDLIYDTSSGRNLNFDLLQKECDLTIVANVGSTFNDKTGYRIMATGRNGISYSTLYPGEGRPKESVPLVAYPNKDCPGQVLLACDCRRLPANFTSIYLVAQDSAGKPATNAVVLIRGAQTLKGPLSIVTPHPIVIAGDFNAIGDAFPCSIITSQDIQTQPANWANDFLGPP
jgi:type II secretory pathway component PulJ